LLIDRVQGPGWEDELRLLSTLTHFGTAVDVTVAELRLEAFLPADAATSDLLNQLDGDVVPEPGDAP
jgi:hypothetical protein